MFGPITLLTPAARERYTGVVATPKDSSQGGPQLDKKAGFRTNSTQPNPSDATADHQITVPKPVDEIVSGIGENLFSMWANRWFWGYSCVVVPAAVNFISIHFGGPAIIDQKLITEAGIVSGTLAGLWHSFNQISAPVKAKLNVEVQPAQTREQKENGEPPPPTQIVVQRKEYVPNPFRKAGRAAVFLTAAGMFASEVNSLQQQLNSGAIIEKPSVPADRGNSTTKPNPAPKQ